jgi:hypothetical protein
MTSKTKTVVSNTTIFFTAIMTTNTISWSLFTIL